MKIELDKFCAFIIGAVVLLIERCESTYTYLNYTAITVKNGGDIDRFTFTFRTCSAGVLLRDETNNLTISIISGNDTRHSFLRLSWEENNSFQVLDLKEYLSIDANVGIEVELHIKENNSIFAITNLDLAKPVKYSINASRIDNFILSGNLTLGSDTFIGCFSSGTNIDIDNFANTCSLVENLQRCVPKAACPQGFAGRYCQNDIDECATSIQQCHFPGFSSCVDLINGFRCVCGPQWNGTLCDNLIEDLCENNPCQNGGTCTLTNDKNNYTCNCFSHTHGWNCEHVDYCLASRCQNGGICESNSTGFTCRCLPGSKGEFCEIKVDPCAKFPCDTGQCTNLGNGNSSCNCSNTGLYGERCEHNIDECRPDNPCRSGGVCEDKWASYICKCVEGYDGTDCEIDIDDCAGNPCSGRGNCTDKVNSYECSCRPGFNGSRCENNIDECVTNTCHAEHSEPCVDGDNEFICPCKPGYNGTRCETEINECEANPCHNSISCQDLVASYQCFCIPGFRGDNCSENTNECAAHPCGAHGSCEDGINKYTCTCDTGYIGDNCETNKDDCDPDPCQHHGVCKDKVDDYTCDCIYSYTGKNCTVFQDPCAVGRNPCQNGATCSEDDRKGFTCECLAGYEGNTCQYKFSICYPNPCANGNCTIKSSSSYNCTCDVGYVGTNCSENVKECVSNPCKNGGQCIDGIGTYKCDCPRDRMPPNCENLILACPQYLGTYNEDFCLNGGQCIELGNFEKRCKCVLGYNGKRCKNNIDECELGYCKHRSRCTDLVNDYNCTCVPGYTNKNCSEEINECDPDPCDNNANCTDLLNNYRCECAFGYEGKNCSTDIDWCERSPCAHGGTCIDLVATYTCNCLPGFTGRNCSNDTNECSPNPCVYHDVRNNVRYESTCVEKSNETAMTLHGFPVNTSTFENRDGFICDCLAGLNGTTCSNNIQNCTSTTCVNDANCTDLIDDFHCQCHPGYTGKRCEIDINECEDTPCQNNATCTNLVNEYNCTCRNNFLGTNCSVIVSNCSHHNPCRNSTTTSCHFDGSNYTCTCVQGFTGKFCTDETNVNLNGIGYLELPMDTVNDTESSPKRLAISLSFVTTLRSGLILYISFANGSSLHVVIGGERLISIVIGGERVGSSDRDQNNGKWHTIFVNMMENTGSFQFDNGTAYSHTSLVYRPIKNLYVGGTPGESQTQNYTGCMRDVTVNGKVFVPTSGLVGDVVNGSCSRQPQCNGSSCSHGNGECIDKWLTSECNCKTQYFGENCESEFQSFSFGEVTKFVSNTTRSRRRRTTGTVIPYAFSNVTGTFDETSRFTFRIRTRQSNNLIALLVDRDHSSSYLAFFLNNSKLTFKTPGLAHPAVLLPWVLDDGIWHEIIVTPTNISDNGKKRSIFPPLVTFNVSGIYLGGVDSTIHSDVIFGGESFDGCLQAVKLKNTVLTSSSVPGLSTSNTTFPRGGVKLGCPSNNPCGIGPCVFGNCTDEWWAYSCSCPSGFYGRTCELYGCGVANRSDPCSNRLDCVDVSLKPGETICSTSLTFNGRDSRASIKFENITVKYLSFAFQTRRRDQFLFASYKPAYYFVVGIKNGNLLVQANYYITNISIQGTTFVSDGVRHDIEIKDVDGNTSITDNSNGTQKITEYSGSILADDWLELLTNRTLVIASDASPFITGLFNETYFGAFSLKKVGEQVPVQGDFSSENVTDGWNSTDPCKTSPCVRGNCSDIFNDYTCGCPTFFTKKNCDQTVDVSCSFGHLCENNGTCVNLNETEAVTLATTGEKFSDNGMDKFKCQCSPGYTGFRCRNVTDECSLPNTCENNGTCIDKHLGYWCACTAGWEGVNCTDNINDCEPTPCRNQGTCTDRVNDYECQCYKGRYKGKNCTEDVDECLNVNGSNPCYNRGNCTNRDHGYNCSCNSGFYGDMCQYNNSEYCAAVSPCNNGECSTEGVEYKCKCVSAYTGTHCDEDFDECGHWNPCQNNGTCLQTPLNGPNRGLGYNCTCSDRYEGTNCTDEKDRCQNNPCLNSGVCNSDGYPDYNCVCLSGYVGTNCGALRTTGVSGDSTTVIVVVVVVVLVVVVIAIILFICYYKRHSGQEGTYKPGEEEHKGGVEKELDVIRKPKVERLI